VPSKKLFFSPNLRQPAKKIQDTRNIPKSTRYVWPIEFNPHGMMAQLLRSFPHLPDGGAKKPCFWCSLETDFSQAWRYKRLCAGSWTYNWSREWCEVESDAEFSVEAPETDYNSWKGRVFRKYVSDGLALVFLLKKAVFRYFNVATCSSPMPDSTYSIIVGDENKGY
jgi:hypothetical protein